MDRKKMFVLICVVVSFSAVMAFAGAYPDDMIENIKAMKADAEAKKDMPASLAGIPNVGTDEAHRMLKAKKAVFLDNRVKTQYDTEKISGAEWLFADDLITHPALADKLDKNKDYVLYCNGVHCWRSPAAALMLNHLGFKKIHWYRDGIPDWKKKGYPTE